jgi:Tfp pilus assembly protein PilN
MFGLGGLVAETMADDHVVKYHLNGFNRCSEAVRRFCVVGSAVAWAADVLIREVLADDRALRRREELEKSITAELAFLEAQKLPMWARLGRSAS